MAKILPHPGAQTNERNDLAETIDTHRYDIEEEWLKQVEAEVNENEDLTPTDLRDSIGDYLKQLAESLRHESRSNETRGKEVWRDIAHKHATTRVQQGFNVEQLIHEFILLRKILIKFACKEGSRVNADQAETLTSLIEGAILVAVKSYVDSRDYEFRKSEAEHIGFVTHELRNPLTVATVAASEICCKVKHSEQTRELCKLLESSHQRVAKLIDTVLLSEKLRAQALEVDPIDTSLGRILDESLRNARMEAQRKGLRLQFAFNPQMDLFVDTKLTTSAVQNLMDNAVKYAERGSIDLLVEDSLNEFTFHVRDKCHGISPEELKIIFEPFKRGRSGKPGAGLGLAIARRAIEIQGGQIYAESDNMNGCHFWFRLPKRVSLKKKKDEEKDFCPQ